MPANTRLTRAALVAALAAAAPAAAQAPAEGPLTHAPRPTSGPISVQDLRTHVYVLADDSMMGREAGSRGNVQGTDYVAAQLRRMGLQPAGDNGTFFQNVPLISRGPRAGGTLSVDGTALAATDFVAMPTVGGFLLFGPSFNSTGAPAVYGGRIGEPGTMITPEQAAGKFIVFAAPLGQNGQPVSQFWQRGTLERYHQAAGIAIATLDLTSRPTTEFFRSTQVELDHGEAPVPAAPGVIVTSAAAERMMGAPLAGLQVGAAGRTVSGSFGFEQKPTAFPARNVVAVLPGSDPVLRNQYVAVGAHNDHVGTSENAVDHDSLHAFNQVFRPEGADQQPDSVTPEKTAQMQAILQELRRRRPTARRDSVYNGADDDASGTAAVLEIAQYLQTRRPRRSVVFVWHTAEEMGLYGSEYFTDHPTVPRDSIVAQLNMDMVGRGGAGDVKNGGPGYLELVGSRRLSTHLGDLIEEVNRTGSHGFTFDYTMDAAGHPQQIYCRSDHYNYARYGIPITFFTTGGHYDYHMVTDEAQYIDFEKLHKVSHFVASVAEAIANRPDRLALTAPRPDPHGQCRQ
ncbi:MAG TPA: M28 family peptidase [Longimicrobium sp.]|nr:M28 family peptidase [Longimicrobium sp.]